MAIVAAYLLCNSKTETGDTGDEREVFVTFFPNYDDERNRAWARYMPNLTLSTMLRGTVADQLTEGQPYVLTIDVEEV